MPSQQLAEELFELQIEAIEREKFAGKNEEQLLPGIRTYFGQKEQAAPSVMSLCNALRARLGATISTLAREKLNKSETLTVWSGGTFSTDVRTHLSARFGIDPDDVRYRTFERKLAEEFGEWSQQDEEGMNDIRLRHEDGEIFSDLGKRIHGTKLRHGNGKPLA